MEREWGGAGAARKLPHRDATPRVPNQTAWTQATEGLTPGILSGGLTPLTPDKLALHFNSHLIEGAVGVDGARARRK